MYYIKQRIVDAFKVLVRKHYVLYTCDDVKSQLRYHANIAEMQQSAELIKNAIDNECDQDIAVSQVNDIINLYK